VRVPLIVHWPGVTKPGSVSDTPVITTDLFRTLAEVAGLKVPEGAGPDGVSLGPLLRGTGGLARTELFWHYPHHQHYQQGGTMPYGAVRSGDYKLIEFFNDGRAELYDLKADVGEEHDLAAAQPEVARRLRERLSAWRREVGAQMPTPNPRYDPTKPEYTPPKKKGLK
jgi:arylsulfatase A-like enzyme